MAASRQSYYQLIPVGTGHPVEAPTQAIATAASAVGNKFNTMSQARDAQYKNMLATYDMAYKLTAGSPEQANMFRLGDQAKENLMPARDAMGEQRTFETNPFRVPAEHPAYRETQAGMMELNAHMRPHLNRWTVAYNGLTPAESMTRPYQDNPKDLSPLEDIKYDAANLEWINNYNMNDASLGPDGKKQWEAFYQAQKQRDQNRWILARRSVGYMQTPRGIQGEYYPYEWGGPSPSEKIKGEVP